MAYCRHQLLLLDCHNHQIYYLRLQKWAKCQKPARNNFFGKLAVLTYASNNLTNLEYEGHPFTKNGYVESGFKKPGNHNVTN